MRRYALSFSGLVALVLLLNQGVLAQDKKEKTKVGSGEEIIIKRKGDKDAKITIEIKGDAVTVNGKPIEDYENDDVVIRKRRSGSVFYTTPGSPFRAQSGTGTLNFNSDNHGFGFADANSNTAFLGVTTKEAGKGGAAIEEVTKESAAEKAGLKKGDVIKKINDETIEKPSDLTKAIREHKPEDKVTVTYERDGKESKATATLGKRKGFGSFNLAPEVYAMPRSFDFDMHNGQLDNLLTFAGRPRLGIKAQDTEDGKGVKVIDVDDESAAEKAGLKEDDIITEFDGVAVNSVDKLAGLAREAKEKASVKVKYTRNGKSQTVEIKTPRKLKTANL